MATNAAEAIVQHVTKASSDELLSKFAELGSDDHPKKQSKRQKRIQSSTTGENTDSGGVLVERKSLLPPAVGRRSSGAVVRQIRVGRAHFRSRNFRSRSFLGTIEKTWRRTVEGASKVFKEKHYNRHKRLISDIA